MTEFSNYSSRWQLWITINYTTLLFIKKKHWLNEKNVSDVRLKKSFRTFSTINCSEIPFTTTPPLTLREINYESCLLWTKIRALQVQTTWNTIPRKITRNVGPLRRVSIYPRPTFIIIKYHAFSTPFLMWVIYGIMCTDLGSHLSCYCWSKNNNKFQG